MTHEQPNPTPERLLPILLTFKKEFSNFLKWFWPAIEDVLPSVRTPRQKPHPNEVKHESNNLRKATSEYDGRYSHGSLLTPLTTGVKHILGGTFTGADILLTTCIVSGHNHKLKLSAVILDYMNRITSREAYQRALVANRRP